MVSEMQSFPTFLLTEFLPVMGVLVAVGGIVAAIANGQFTALGRSKRARQRRVNARAAELVMRGHSEYHALKLADIEIENEAEASTRMLKDAGVEK